MTQRQAELSNITLRRCQSGSDEFGRRTAMLFLLSLALACLCVIFCCAADDLYVSLSLSLYGWPSPAGGGALAEVGAQGRQDCQRPDPREERRSGGTDHAGVSERGGDRKRLCTKHHPVLRVGSAPQQHGVSWVWVDSEQGDGCRNNLPLKAYRDGPG